MKTLTAQTTIQLLDRLAKIEAVIVAAKDMKMGDPLPYKVWWDAAMVHTDIQAIRSDLLRLAIAPVVVEAMDPAADLAREAA